MIDLLAANHTNRELELMLAGKKPLAVFWDEESFYPNDEIFPETHFSPHVNSGRLVSKSLTAKGIFIPKLGRTAQWKYLMYAVAEESWRIPAMVHLINIRLNTISMWQSEGLERYESSLLGYSDEEVDAWCLHRFHKV
jgi:hypothetical protein